MSLPQLPDLPDFNFDKELESNEKSIAPKMKEVTKTEIEYSTEELETKEEIITQEEDDNSYSLLPGTGLSNDNVEYENPEDFDDDEYDEENDKPKVPKSKYTEDGVPILTIPDLDDVDLFDEIDKYFGDSN